MWEESELILESKWWFLLLLLPPPCEFGGMKCMVDWCLLYPRQWRIWGGHIRRAPPHGPKFSWFHAVFRKFWKNRMLAPLPPPPRVGAPPTGNPGSAPARGKMNILNTHLRYGAWNPIQYPLEGNQRIIRRNKTHILNVVKINRCFIFPIQVTSL